MDPVSLIVAALVAGASAGLSDSAKSAVVSAYNELRDLLKKKLGNKRHSAGVLEPQLDDIPSWEQSLRQELDIAGLGSDETVMMHVRRLLELAGYDADVLDKSARYQTNFHGSVGTAVVGDNAKVNVTIKKS